MVLTNTFIAKFFTGRHSPDAEKRGRTLKSLLALSTNGNSSAFFMRFSAPPLV
jgi:hypothetical protein